MRQELVQAIRLLFPAEYQVTDREGSLLDIVILVSPQALEVLGCANTCDQVLFFQAINIFLSGNVRLLFIKILYPECSERDISWQDSL